MTKRSSIHPDSPSPEWISLQQAAQRCGVSVDTVRRRIASGRLPGRRFGARLIRVRLEDVENLLLPIPTVRRNR